MTSRSENHSSVAWNAFNVFDKKSHNVTDALLYARVSSKKQVKQGHGLESQETRLREFAKFKGYRVVDVYTDDLTGKVSARGGIQSLLAHLVRHKDKRRFVVLIDDITRFARSVRAHEDLRDAIIAAGGIIESPSVEFGHDADSRMIEYVLATMSQHHREKNAEQTVNRMRARLMNGYWCFQPPVGYAHEKVEGHGKLIVRDEPIAAIIQEALEGFAAGRFETQSEVKRFLESQPDFPKDLPDGRIRYQRVNELLRRVVYAGMVEAPDWNVGLREGKHEGLISLETYRKIQCRLEAGAKAPARKDINKDFPLRGFVVCGGCEKPLTACWSTSKTGKKHPYYSCYNRGCESYRKSIRRDLIEGDFEELLSQLGPSRRLVDLTGAMFKKAWSARLRQADKLQASLRREIADLERQVEQLVDRVVDAASPSDATAYERRIAKLEQDKLVAAEKLRTGPGPARPFGEMFELAMRFFLNPWKLWTSGPLHHRRMVLKLAFAKRLPYCRETGFSNPIFSLPFNMLTTTDSGKCKMARSRGLEPLTF